MDGWEEVEGGGCLTLSPTNDDTYVCLLTPPHHLLASQHNTPHPLDPYYRAPPHPTPPSPTITTITLPLFVQSGDYDHFLASYSNMTSSPGGLVPLANDELFLAAGAQETSISTSFASCADVKIIQLHVGDGNGARIAPEVDTGEYPEMRVTVPPVVTLEEPPLRMREDPAPECETPTDTLMPPADEAAAEPVVSRRDPDSVEVDEVCPVVMEIEPESPFVPPLDVRREIAPDVEDVDVPEVRTIDPPVEASAANIFV